VGFRWLRYLEMARIVVMRDHGPLKIKKEEMDDVVTVCRCGLSAGWPYCDGTHAKTTKEEPNVVLQYARKGRDAEIVASEIRVNVAEADPRPWTRETVADGAGRT
jgi:CDGSH-type Zn-finger protein